MSTSATLRAADGMTVPELASAMKGKVGQAAEDLMMTAGTGARKIIAEEGHRFYIRARKTRKPIHLGGKLGPHSAKKAVVYGIPAGFFTIIEQGAKEHRIERKLVGRGKNRRAQLLGRKDIFGPVPYVLHAKARATGKPWEQAMVKVNSMENTKFEVAIKKAFAGLWR